ncbi:hypothetical protein KDA_47550 [Dictyobacter alpinus]|uniref:HTH arsR-type domain-containing protein n=1 Tax=Dictyobacter alpinus TaxID=2014873 RepID=A0A402BCZ9_9CHLR|nr:winged helix-turn-helix domain-containing protein [Dictyobacter alpinus]GCE29271.1 hypothetical protein KDA_47550 [Dictyobacter alpinus]
MGDSMNERLAELEVRLAVVEERLRTLEKPVGMVEFSAETSTVNQVSWSDRLSARLLPASPGNEPMGLIAYAGAVRGEEGEIAWDFERKVEDLLALDVEPIAQVLAACGSIPRLELVRLLLHGPQNSQQLQEALGLSSGPLYYHLKELMAVGIVSQPTRNSYQVAPQRVVPFLALLVAALDVRGL